MKEKAVFIAGLLYQMESFISPRLKRPLLPAGAKRRVSSGNAEGAVLKGDTEQVVLRVKQKMQRYKARKNERFFALKKSNGIP